MKNEKTNKKLQRNQFSKLGDQMYLTNAVLLDPEAVKHYTQPISITHKPIHMKSIELFIWHFVRILFVRYEIDLMNNCIKLLSSKYHRQCICLCGSRSYKNTRAF